MSFEAWPDLQFDLRQELGYYISQGVGGTGALVDIHGVGGTGALVDIHGVGGTGALVDIHGVGGTGALVDIHGVGGTGALVDIHGVGGTGALVLASNQGVGGTGALVLANVWVAKDLRPIAPVNTNNASTETTSHLFIDPPSREKLRGGVYKWLVAVKGENYRVCVQTVHTPPSLAGARAFPNCPCQGRLCKRWGQCYEGTKIRPVLWDR